MNNCENKEIRDAINVKFLTLGKNFSVSEWKIVPLYSSISILTLFRKWLYSEIKVKKIVGVRIDDSIILLENNFKISESNLNLVEKLKNLTFKSNNPDLEYLKFSSKTPQKIFAKNIFENDLEDIHKETLLIEHLEGEITLEFLLSDNINNILSYENKDYLNVSKDTNSILRCYFQEEMFDKNCYKVVIETLTEMDHNDLILKFRNHLVSLSQNFEFSEIENNKGDDSLYKIGISERDSKILSLENVIDLKSLFMKYKDLNLSTLSLDGVKIINEFIDNAKKENNFEKDNI